MKSTYKLLCFVLFLLAACAALGPVSEPEFPRLVQNAVPEQDGTAILFGPGIWIPNTLGFTDTRSSGLTRGQEPVPGILVITDSAILILQWDKERGRFELIKRFALSGVREVRLDKYGLNRRVVIRWQDYSVDSFSFTKSGGQLIDVHKTEEAAAWLQTNCHKSGN